MVVACAWNWRWRPTRRCAPRPSLLVISWTPGQGLSRVLLTFESDQDSSEPGDEPVPTVAGVVSAVGALGATRVEPGLIQSALQRSVDFARYWQEPDGEDRLAALPEVAAALLPLAEAVVESAEVAWWSQAFSTDQWLVQWQTSGGRPSRNADLADCLV